MADLLDTHVYGVIGEEGFRRLVAAFYRRGPTDDILSPMYPKRDMAGAEERLRGSLIRRLGGPDLSSQRRGPPRLRMRPAPLKITKAGRDRWVQLMEAALAEADLPPEVHPPLRQFI